MSSLHKSSYNISTYSRFNLSQSESDIHVFVREYKERIKRQLAHEEESGKNPFVSFARKRLSVTDITWLQENQDRFFKDTANEALVKLDYWTQYGFITCMAYSADGEFIIVGHASGLIQKLVGHVPMRNMEIEKQILAEYENKINSYYEGERRPKPWYPMFYKAKLKEKNRYAWVQENYEKFLRETPNEILYNRWLFSEMGAITALQYAPSGTHIIVGHSSGLIQMRHGVTGTVLCTLRNLQFPPKPVYAIEYSHTEERVCYAACMDGAVYRIEIPTLGTDSDEVPAYCIKVDPALESLNLQFYGSPGISSYSTPFITQRSPALALGLAAESNKIVVGYGDTSIKVYDMETQEADVTYKVHKLRLQFIPRKLQRMHSGQVCALRCHNQRPFVFASGSWDNTLRIWDWRCPVGCVMTFEGVDICSDSIDINRDHCVAGSWQPTEALTVWDITAKKRLNIIRVQNRRPDVDGEYIYACRYWRSNKFNRKGKYAIIGGSGTNCLEVINLHNRYITCAYPTPGTILAVTSHQERIAFGGTAPIFSIVEFYDPKHERDKYKAEVEPDYDYTKPPVLFEDDHYSMMSSESGVMKDRVMPSVASVASSRISAVTSSRIAPVTSSTIAPVTSSTVPPVTSSTTAPVTSSTITPVTSSAITPVTSSKIAPVTSSKML